MGCSARASTLRDDPLQVRLELRAKARQPKVGRDVRARGLPTALEHAVRLQPDELFKGVRKGGGARLTQPAGLAVHDRFARASETDRDDRPPGRHRLERHDAEVLKGGRVDDRRTALEEALPLIVAHVAPEVHGVAKAGRGHERLKLRVILHLRIRGRDE